MHIYNQDCYNRIDYFKGLSRDFLFTITVVTVLFLVAEFIVEVYLLSYYDGVGNLPTNREVLSKTRRD